MKNTILKSIGMTAAAFFVLVIFAPAFVSAQDETKNVDSGLENLSTFGEFVKKLEGSWDVQTTGRNCQTGVPIGATTPSMLTFNYGGTMQEFGTRNAPSLRGPGLGVWDQKSARNYTSAFQFFRFNADGTLAGRQIIRQEIELNDSGDEFTSTATSQILDAGGNVISNGCSSGVATRFE
jgi:hypothetical protein